MVRPIPGQIGITNNNSLKTGLTCQKGVFLWGKLAHNKAMKPFDPFLIPQENLPEIIYHYCSAASFYGIVQSRSIWLSSSLDMNDLSETKFLKHQIVQYIRKIKHAIMAEESSLRPSSRLFSSDFDRPEQSLKEKLTFLQERLGLQTLSDLLDSLVAQALEPIFPEDVPYIASFSREKDLLSQWVKYGHGGTGICIGFDTRRLMQLIQKANTSHNPCLSEFPLFSLHPISYDPKACDEYIQSEFERLLQNVCEWTELILKTRRISYIRQEDLDESMMIQLNAFVDDFSILSLRRAGLFKHEGFEEEAEYRLMTIDPLLFDQHILQARTLPVECHYINDKIRTHITLDLSGQWDKGLIKSVATGPAYKGNLIDIEYFVRTQIHPDAQFFQSSIPFRL